MLRYVNLVLKDNLCDCPFVPSKKCNPAIAAAAPYIAGGSALSSLIGGIFGSSSNSSANKTNLEIARMNQQSQREANAMNERLFNTSMAYNSRMWDKQNEYNLPINQVNRLLAAGINPVTAFGQPAEAGSLTAPNAPNIEAATLDYQQKPYDISGAFQGAVNAFTQSRLASSAIEKQREETHGITLDNVEKEKGMMDRLDYLHKMSQEKGYLGELAKTQLDFEMKAFNIRQAMLGADYTMQLKQITRAQKEIDAAELQNELYNIQISYARDLNEAQLKQYYATVNQIKAQIGLINANTLLTDVQRVHEIEKKTGTIIDNGLKGFDLKLKDEVKDYLKERYNLDNINLGLQINRMYNQDRYGELGYRALGSSLLRLEDGGKSWIKEKIGKGYNRFSSVYKRGVEKGMIKKGSPSSW